MKKICCRCLKEIEDTEYLESTIYDGRYAHIKCVNELEGILS